MKKLERADKRWGSRYTKAIEALDRALGELKDLAELDQEHPDAVWSSCAESAEGCVEGAKQLLLQAYDAVEEKRLGAWPCRHTLYNIPFPEAKP